MNINEINIRDPFVLCENGKYYMYGTRGASCWGACDGFDVYVSTDMTEFEGPIEAFHAPEGFWADRNFWAPEVYSYNGAYYMFASFKNETECRGTQIMKADSPVGPFRLHSDGPVTPRNWECLDGTLAIDPDGTPYMVFCHEWVQVVNGEVCAIQLTKDLQASVGEPVLLFRASDPAWKKDEKMLVTDGPFVYRTESGKLLMIWSSFTEKGYCEGIVYSETGSVLGPWHHDERLLFEEDGGHGMIYKTPEGKLCFIYHQPNQTPLERPHVVALKEENGTLFKA